MLALLCFVFVWVIRTQQAVVFLVAQAATPRSEVRVGRRFAVRGTS